MSAEKASSSGTAATPPAGETSWRPKVNPWLIAVVVALAAFMEFLDTSIANVALPYMAGNLGATNDESTWILTSYLASNAIVLPLSGWLAGFLGRKRFFMICLALFTLSSLLCGLSPTLGAIILFRTLQGAGGGAGDPGRYVSSPAARDCVRNLRCYSRVRAHNWTYARRLDY